MGIKGLLPKLKSITKNVNLKDLNFTSCAVDGYAWLHKSIYSCGEELIFRNDISKMVSFFEHKITDLLEMGIKVVIVYDGAYFSLKGGTEEHRKKSRARKTKEGIELLNLGKKKEGIKMLLQAFDISPEIAFAVKKKIMAKFGKTSSTSGKEEEYLGIHEGGSVEFLVAPFEADPQLAHLSRSKYVDLVICEDSDLLVFGSHRVLYKMTSKYEGQLIESKDVLSTKEIEMKGWNFYGFIYMCIMSGCDYLDSPTGIGMKTANNYMNSTPNIKKLLKKLKEKNKISEEYIYQFKRAFTQFNCGRVYCPFEKKMLHLNSFPLNDLNTDNFDEIIRKLKEKDPTFPYKWLKEIFEREGNFEFLGEFFEKTTLEKLKKCEINPDDLGSFSGKYLEPLEQNKMIPNLKFKPEYNNSKITRTKSKKSLKTKTKIMKCKSEKKLEKYSLKNGLKKWITKPEEKKENESKNVDEDLEEYKIDVKTKKKLLEINPVSNKEASEKSLHNGEKDDSDCADLNKTENSSIDNEIRNPEINVMEYENPIIDFDENNLNQTKKKLKKEYCQIKLFAQNVNSCKMELEKMNLVKGDDKESKLTDENTMVRHLICLIILGRVRKRFS